MRLDEAMEYLLNKMSERVHPILKEYWGSDFAAAFDRQWKDKTAERFRQTLEAPPEAQEAIWEICEADLLETLESMEYPQRQVPQESAEDVLELIYAELERLIEEEQVHEQMLGPSPANQSD